MQNKKKTQLQVIQNDQTVLENETCFSMHAKYKVSCQRKHCSNWISHSTGFNCVMISASNGSHTLQEIGKMYNLTRMRICQIEKGIYEKIRLASQ